MDFDLAVSSRRTSMISAGFWQDKTMDDFLSVAMREYPEKEALVCYRIDKELPERITYRQLDKRVERAAYGLLKLGVRHGDVVAIQLPNWAEFVIATLACGRIGAVVNPLMHIFRERELSYMLEFTQAKVLITPNFYRDFDFSNMALRLKASLPSLAHVVVVDSLQDNSFQSILQSEPNNDIGVTLADAHPLKPDDLAVLMFTSGTTGSPKGVMHTSNTLLACMNALSGRFGLHQDDIFLASTPVGHMTGYVAVVLLGLRKGGTVVLQDLWDPRKAAQILISEKISYFAGSTPFLNDLCEVVAAGQHRPAALRSFLCGGAPIPPILIDRAEAILGIKVCSLWGMTEVLSGTLTEPERAHEKSANTDGRPLEGMEILIVDDNENPCATGQSGRLWVRGAQMFLGYYKMGHLDSFNEQGWFDSGDLAYSDTEGYIRICGRTKDVLIRGGENVPVVEIEALLARHPSVLTTAIVGYPDQRLGERACAFVVLRPAQSLTLSELQNYMQECKVAKQYWPEKLSVLDLMPTTASGKIQKFKLKELASSFNA